MKYAIQAPQYRRFLIVLLAILPVGCGGPKQADPDKARETLTTALDAWRDGRTVDDVNNGRPAITVADPSWKAGFKLDRYEVASSNASQGLDLKIPVELWLQNPKGKAVRQKVKYIVSVQPARTVLRSPF